MDSLEFVLNFKQALDVFSRYSRDKDAINNLVTASFLLLSHVLHTLLAQRANKRDLIDANDYITIIDDLLKEAHIENVALSEESKSILERIIRTIDKDDNGQIRQGFPALTIANEHYLKKPTAESVISTEIPLKQLSVHHAKIQTDLLWLRHTADELAADDEEEAAEETRANHDELKLLVNTFFTLTPNQQKKECRNFHDQMKMVCSKNDHNIAKHIQLKTIYYNLLLSAFGIIIIYGIALLVNYCRKRPVFFQPEIPTLRATQAANLILANTLEEIHEESGPDTPDISFKP